MSRLLWRSSLRYYMRHPWLLWLSILGVALGVAVVTAVDLASASARESFKLSSTLVGATATHRIVAGHAGVDEALYAALRLHGLRPVAPVIEGVLTLPGRSLRLLGIDPLAGAPFARAGSGLQDLAVLLTRPGALLLHPGMANELGVKPGDAFSAAVGGRVHQLLLAGWLQLEDAARDALLEGVAVTDIATAQELLGRLGRLSRIDLVAPAHDTEAWLDLVRQRLPEGVQLQAADYDHRFMTELTAAFSLNLAALSLLALLVGGFLVYNMLGFAVLQRLPQLGILRALGVGRGELFRLVSGEALLIGLLGSVLGLLLGTLLGHGLVGLVTRTIDELYIALDGARLHLAPSALVKGLAFGLGATWLAALRPACEAMGASSAAVMRRSWAERRARHAAVLGALLGLPVMLAAAGLLAATQGLLAGFTALFLLVLGAVLVVPAGLLAGARLLGRRTLLRGTVTRLAVAGLGATLSRTGVAAAALTVAVATTVGVGEMIDSFRLTVDRWLQHRLQADVYVSSASALDRTTAVPLEPSLVDRLAALPGVRATSSYRGVSVYADQGPVNLAVVDLQAAGRQGHMLKHGDPRAAWPAFEQGAVLVSEPFAHRSGLGVGDTLGLLTPSGMHDFPVAGIYFDYGSGAGHVLLARSAYAAHWGEAGISSLGLYVEPGHDPRVLLEQALSLAREQPVNVRSNAALREASLAIFDRTFRVTGVLRLLLILVAFAGVLSACLALQLERQHEYAMLRALGLLPAQLRWLATLQAGLLGLVAGLLALPLGLLQAAVLTTVINQRAFGWTLPLLPSAGPLLEALLLAVGAALLAGLLATTRVARPPHAALQVD